MKFCSKCGKEVLDEAMVCPNCGCAVVDPGVQKENPDDQVNIGLCILSALIPLIGMIYWLVHHKETPKKAQIYGITAVIAAVIYFSISL